MKCTAIHATSCLWSCDEMYLFFSVDWYSKEQNRTVMSAVLRLNFTCSFMEGTANLHGRTDSSAFFNRNIRVAVLPCSESTSCLFRTRPVEASDNLVYNEVFWVSISYPALRQKTLRVDVCTVDKSHLEECLVSINLYFYIFVFVSSFELGKILNSGVWQFLWKCSWWSLAIWSLTVFFSVTILIKKKPKIC